MIPHNRVVATRADIDAVAKVIASGHLAAGPEGEALEHEMCELSGRKYGVCVASGLAAIRLSLLCFRNRLPVIPGYCCVALQNAVYSWSDKVGIADIVPREWVIDPDDLGHDLEPEVVVAVNTFGVKSDTVSLLERGAAVIEDCTHGFGNHVSDCEVLSFHATKLIGGAAGGIVLTDSEHIAGHVRNYRDYGDKLPSGLRLNDTMSDVHAALVRSKLKRLPLLIEEREELARLYLRELRGAPVGLPVTEERTWYRFAIETPDADYYCRRLEQVGIRAEKPVWDWIEEGRENIPVSVKAYGKLVSLPLYPGLKREEVQYISKWVREISSDIRVAA